MRLRRKKLIRLDVQLRVVLIALCVASFVLLINFQLCMTGLEVSKGKFSVGTSPYFALEGLRSLLVSRFLVSIALSIPMAALVGVLYSFKFAGPIFRFSKYFHDLQAGSWNQRCAVRKGDDLQDLCVSINGAIDPIRDSMVKNQGILEDLRAMVKKGSLNARSGAEAELKSLMERVAAACSLCEERLSRVECSEEISQGSVKAKGISSPCAQEEHVVESQV